MDDFVTKLVFDNWQGINCVEQEVKSPTYDDVEKVICDLDAKTHTIVTIYGHLGAYLTVGGGDQQYVVYLSSSNQELWNLKSRENGESKTVLINVGGQEGDFSIEYVIDKKQVMQAAFAFYKSGQMNSRLIWEKQV